MLEVQWPVMSLYFYNYIGHAVFGLDDYQHKE